MEKEGRKGKETVSVKRRCFGFISLGPFDIFRQGEEMESCGGVSWGDLLERSLVTCPIVSLRLGLL